MQKKFEKGSDEWQFFMDYYQFRQKYYEADNEEEWVTEMMIEGEKLIEKYSGTQIFEYVRGMVFEHFADIERKIKKRKGEN